MKRILLFLVTNFAILFVASITLRLLGLEPYLNAQGINFTSLLVFGGLIRFGGAFICPAPPPSRPGGASRAGCRSGCGSG